MCEGGKNVQISSFKISKSQGCNVQQVTTVNHPAYLKVARRVDIKSSHHRGKKNF